MRPIPVAQKNSMASDRYYEHCCIGGDCSGRIEWHHNLIIAGSQSNERWSILPLCHKHHMEADHSEMKERLNWIMLNRATPIEIRMVSKAINYQAMKERLEKKYG